MKLCGNSIHEMTPENTRPNGRCRACRIISKRAWIKAHPRKGTSGTPEYQKNWYRQNPEKVSYLGGLNILNKFLKMCGLGKNYDIRNLVKEPTISNDFLRSLVGTSKGWPDWVSESTEEKGPKPDWLSIAQWSRAILEYREERSYKVAHRFTRTKSILFETIFDYYDWVKKVATS